MSPRGQALVEFALTVMGLIVLIVALFDIGRAVYTYNALTNATREGARLAIVNQDKATIIDRAKGQTAIAELDIPNVTVEFYQAADDGTANTSEPCPPDPPVAGQNYVAVGCLAVVKFEATYRPITPLIGNLVFPNGVTYTAESTLPVEFSCPNNDITTAAGCPKQP